MPISRKWAFIFLTVSNLFFSTRYIGDGDNTFSTFMVLVTYLLLEAHLSAHFCLASSVFHPSAMITLITLM